MPNIFPRIMVDASYSNSQLFFSNPDVVNYSGGDVILKLKNDFEVNAFGLFLRNFSGNHHKLYGGIGANFSEYSVTRNIFKEPTYPPSHFGKYYVFNPSQLNYNIQILRFNLQLCHYTFYKRVMLFQKIGLTYSSFIKKSNSVAQYIEQYGNSYPTMDSTYVTTSNPDGWHFVDSYTYTAKNDLDIYKNTFGAFYKFGVGIRIKQFTPFAAFEYSFVSAKFGSSYLKVQFGINYSILPH